MNWNPKDRDNSKDRILIVVMKGLRLGTMMCISDDLAAFAGISSTDKDYAERRMQSADSVGGEGIMRRPVGTRMYTMIKKDQTRCKLESDDLQRKSELSRYVPLIPEKYGMLLQSSRNGTKNGTDR